MAEPPHIAETDFHVRYAETDAQGIVHHASYVVYLEEGRSAYIRQRGSSYAEFERRGYFLAVSEVNVRYLKAARYDDRLLVRCWVEQARSRSLVFKYEIRLADHDDLLVTATTHHICVNRAGVVTRLPKQWQSWFQS